MDEQPRTFAFDEASVTLPLPVDAAFTELEGLEDGARHLTWEPAPGGYFLLSAGTSAGHTADGLLRGEAEREDGLHVDSDAPAPLAGPGARRVAYSVVRRRPRELRDTPAGRVTVAERAVREHSDLLFVPGERQHLRLGYRVDDDAPPALRAQLARVLDLAEVEPADA